MKPAAVSAWLAAVRLRAIGSTSMRRRSGLALVIGASGTSPATPARSSRHPPARSRARRRGIGCRAGWKTTPPNPRSMRQLYLVDNPVDRVARTVEALLVVASSRSRSKSSPRPRRPRRARRDRARAPREPLPGRAKRHRARASRRRLCVPCGEGGGRRVRAPGRAACPAGLSPAALETLAIVAYLGPVSGRRSPGSAASPRTRPSPVWPIAASLPRPDVTARAARSATGRRRSSSESSA